MGAGRTAAASMDEYLKNPADWPSFAETAK
jgi:hypothetical protein